MVEKFPKHDVLLGRDANTKLACHSHGFRTGYAVPHSDMTARDEERVTFFVNFMANSGLVVQSTWTAAAPPQEEMKTGNDRDKQDIICNLTVGTHVDCVLTLETVKATSCRNKENTFMSMDLEAVLPERDMSTEGKKHANKTNVERWKLSPPCREKSEDLKIDWTRYGKKQWKRWQQPPEKT